MREIALNILDIVENSVKAKATKIKIEILADEKFLTVRISDNGKGMSKELLSRVTDPFATTRTTRKVGMGIPFFKETAETTGGSFDIVSELGVGTTTEAVFVIASIDRAPLGNIAETVVTLLSDSDEIDYHLIYRVADREFVFETEQLKQQLGGVSLSEPEILQVVKEYLSDNINNTNGGAIL